MITYLLPLSLSSLRHGPLLWYLNRASGIAVLVLLTIGLVAGIVGAGYTAGRLVPAFAVQRLHRNLTLLSVVFVAVHAAFAILDTFVKISWWEMVWPFFGTYRPVWLGLGAVAFDLMLLLTVTSLWRQRLNPTVWRVIHWSGYAVWPIAVVHSWGTGTDPNRVWARDIAAVCVLALLLAIIARLAARRRFMTPLPTKR